MHFLKFSRVSLVVLALVIFQSTFTVVNTENILFFLPIAMKSHKNVFDPLIHALAERGHNITVVSPIPPSKTKSHENITEIVPLLYTDIFKEFHDPFEQRKEGSMARFNAIEFVYEVSDRIYETKALDILLKEKFDLIFFNGFFNHCFSCFILKLKAPVITLVTMAAPSFITEWIGNYLPPSFVPLSFFPYSDDMSFIERFTNTGMVLSMNLFWARTYGAKFNEVNRKNMGSDCPSVEMLDRNVSMIFSNSFFALTFPRPVNPDVVEVGGMHCRPAKPLPKDLDEFLSEAEHGFIYFSMGSVVQTDRIPSEMRQKFLNVFSRMKQRVIWKWNSGEMEGLPSNVRVSKWLPQQDILGHPKIKVFMTHGGLLSTQESAYHGVPLIGIPIFADQDLNMKQAENNGYALTLEILDFTEEILESLLNKILYDSQYSTKAKKLSSIFRDQMQSPVERAVYWTEYVMKHKGATHLRSASRNLNFFQYHSLDVITFITAVLALIVAILSLSCKLIFRVIYRICGRFATPTKVQVAKKRS